MAELLRVVLDTNVWISGIFFGRGVPAQVLGRWRDMQFEVVMTSATLDELAKVLQRKLVQFEAAPDLEVEWMQYIEAYATKINVTVDLKGTTRDPKDDMMLEAAVAGSVDYLVTGDQDLLVLKEFMGTRIITPREFIDLVKTAD